jgi:histidinol-phosphate aminotransferase
LKPIGALHIEAALEPYGADMSTQTPSPEWVLTLKPYVPGKPIEDVKRELGLSHVVKLASNENPLGPSPKAIAAMTAAVAEVHLYPDPGAYALRQAIGERFSVDPNRVIVSNGSNETVTLLTRAFCTPSENVVFSQYGFVAYRVVSGAAGVGQKQVPALGLGCDLKAMAAACDENTRLLFLANPNNPTGTWSRRDDVVELLRNVPEHVLVVLDEAYCEYVDDPDYPDGLSLLGERENLIVMRTFSKAYGIAGVRVGYAVAPDYVCDRVNRIREPFNVNHVGQTGAIAALGDSEHLAKVVSLNNSERTRVGDALRGLGLEVEHTQTNFVLITVPSGGGAFYEGCLRRGVITRPLQPYGLHEHVRVTLGTREENDAFLVAAAATLGEVQ